LPDNRRKEKKEVDDKIQRSTVLPQRS